LRHYELVVVLSPILNQDQATDVWGRIKDFISNRKGDITHEEKWGTRRLAYPIRKGSYQFLEGNYHLTRFSTDQSFNRELNTFLRLDEQVLRSLVVTTFAPGEEPKPPPPRVRRPDPALAGQPPAAADAAPVQAAVVAADAPAPEAAAPAAETPEATAEADAPADEAAAPAAEEPEAEEAQAVASVDESPEAVAEADASADEPDPAAAEEPEPAENGEEAEAAAAEQPEPNDAEEEQA
jgi:small subunit ribosomal protein S6